MKLILFTSLFASLLPVVRDETRNALGLPKFNGQNGIFSGQTDVNPAAQNEISPVIPAPSTTPQNKTQPNLVDKSPTDTDSGQLVSSNGTESSQDKSNTTYIVVGCAASAVTLVFAIGGIVYSKKRKSKISKKENKNSDNDSTFSNDSVMFSSEELEKLEKDMDYDQYMQKRKSILLPTIPFAE